jgi:hypothetical protein
LEIIIKRVLKKQGMGIRVGFTWSGYGPVAGSCEDDETSVSIKGGEFLNQLGNSQLLKKKRHESYRN